jgi:hypothetical protein
MRFRSWRARTLPAICLGALVLAACGSPSRTGPAVTKTTATFAELPGAQPNYILPLAGLQYFSTSNLSQFQFLMFRPLYWFGTNGQVQLNSSLSLADAPVYSSDGKSVTVTLKGWKWSDGTQITARDIQFWQNRRLLRPADSGRHPRNRDQQRHPCHLHLRGLPRQAASEYLAAGCLRAAVPDQQGLEGHRAAGPAAEHLSRELALVLSHATSSRLPSRDADLFQAELSATPAAAASSAIDRNVQSGCTSTRGCGVAPQP